MDETKNNSWIFYRSWSNFIDELDVDDQKEILYQIYLCGMGREITTENKYLRAYLKDIKEDIDDAKGRYIRSVVSGKKGGRSKIDLDINQIMSFVEDGYTYAQIGKAMGCHANTIGNRVREYKKQKQEQEQQKQTEQTTTTKNKNQHNTYPEEEVKDKVEAEDKGNVDVLQDTTIKSHFEF